jgi:citrate lyase subunit beta/citryl-CoA lyase
MLITAISTLTLPLFVPADRPERFAKAFSAGADAVIIDLEDAVAADRKDTGREALVAAREAIAAAPCPVVVRINAYGQAGHEADCRAVSSLPVAAIMLPKAEAPEIVSGHGGRNRPPGDGAD